MRESKARKRASYDMGTHYRRVAGGQAGKGDLSVPVSGASQEKE